MKEFIKIPLTEDMKHEYEECARMLDEEGIEKDCSECGLNGGAQGCLGECQWCGDV